MSRERGNLISSLRAERTISKKFSFYSQQLLAGGDWHLSARSGPLEPNSSVADGQIGLIGFD
jgi:hypothetical protein